MQFIYIYIYYFSYTTFNTRYADESVEYVKIVTTWCVRTGWTPSRWTTASCTASRTSSSSSSHGETTTKASASIHTRTNGRRRIPTVPRAHRRSRSQTAISDFPSLPSHFFPLPLYVHRYWTLVGFTGGSRRKESHLLSRKHAGKY